MPTLDQMLERQKQENSAVPLPSPNDPRVLRTKVKSMAERVAEGDLSSILPLLENMVKSGTTYCTMVEKLPALPKDSPEAAAVRAALLALPALRGHLNDVAAAVAAAKGR